MLHGSVIDDGIEYRVTKKDGAIFWVHQRMSLETESGAPRLLIVCRDVTEKREMEKKLAHQASHDALTNLINRREFENRLRRIIDSHSNDKESHVLCYMDLDKFKIINDSCGHMAGDKLLCQVATLLEGQIRSRDTLARLGGDEFAVLMEHCSVEQAKKIASKIREIIEGFKFYWRCDSFSIGISIGIVGIKNFYTVEDVMCFADSACYAAKNDGRNCVHVYNSGDHGFLGEKINHK
jgi:diguanylate cyclase (GGDEF)-like protein